MPFTIEDFHDLVRLVTERPEWRADLRRLVLTDELLSLPEQLAKLQLRAEDRFQELMERLTALEVPTMSLAAPMSVQETATPSRGSTTTMAAGFLSRFGSWCMKSTIAWWPGAPRMGKGPPPCEK